MEETGRDEQPPVSCRATGRSPRGVGDWCSTSQQSRVSIGGLGRLAGRPAALKPITCRPFPLACLPGTTSNQRSPSRASQQPFLPPAATRSNAPSTWSPHPGCGGGAGQAAAPPGGRTAAPEGGRAAAPPGRPAHAAPQPSDPFRPHPPTHAPSTHLVGLAGPGLVWEVGQQVLGGVGKEAGGAAGAGGAGGVGAYADFVPLHLRGPAAQGDTLQSIRRRHRAPRGQGTGQGRDLTGQGRDMMGQERDMMGQGRDTMGKGRDRCGQCLAGCGAVSNRRDESSCFGTGRPGSGRGMAGTWDR